LIQPFQGLLQCRFIITYGFADRLLIEPFQGFWLRFTALFCVHSKKLLKHCFHLPMGMPIGYWYCLFRAFGCGLLPCFV